MNNPLTPDKVQPPSSLSLANAQTGDIPVALRDTPQVPKKPRFSKGLVLAGIAAMGGVSLLTGGLVSLQMRQSQNETAIANPAPNPSASPNASASPTPGSNSYTILGHLPYTEAPRSELEPIVSDGSILMRRAAARSFQAMVAAARQEGVSLVPISAFRSKTDQDYLFFNVKADRGQVASERAKVSAPPGYSEHHTGYAVDIGDGNTPATNLSQTFEQTAAYRWLQANAAHFSFELSFPKNNRQGVSYEPWHWRFVGDRNSLETFYKARSMK